jgi:hypothetical protein
MENVHLARTDDEIRACYPVMAQLRPHLGEAEFAACVRQREEQGNRLAFLRHEGMVVAAAGFRLSRSLAWGKFLF